MSFWHGIAAGLVLVVLAALYFFWPMKPEVPTSSVKDTYSYNEEVQPNQLPQPTPEPVSTPTPSTSMRTLPEQMDLAKDFSQAILHTSKGDITVIFYRDESPVTVNNFMNLAKKGFYNSTGFHRIIPDFMIQGGDPLSRDQAQRRMHGTGGPGYKFGDEFNTKPLVRGSLAMANSGPNTNGSQFFIVTAEATPWLDGKHVNFGYVSKGMDVVDAIAKVQVDSYDNPTVPVTITSIELLP